MVPRPKYDNYILISATLFILLVASTIAVSLFMASGIDDTVNFLSEHQQVRDRGQHVEVDGDLALSSIIQKVHSLQTVTYAIVIGTIVHFCATMIAGLWIERQRVHHKSLIEERSQSEKAERQRKREFESLCYICETLAGSEAFGNKSTRFVEELAHVAEADWVTLRLNGQVGQVHKMVVWGSGFANNFPKALVSDHGRLPNTELTEQRNLVVNDYPADPTAVPGVVAIGVNSFVIIPISANEEALGIVTAFSKVVGYFTEERVK